MVASARKIGPNVGLSQARALLGVGVRADAAELRRAFHACVKRAHPDRPGGSPEAFRDVVEAYRALQALAGAPRLVQPPAVRDAPQIEVLTLSPFIALCGGEALHHRPDGRRLKLTLPAGLRPGETVRAGLVTLRVEIRGDFDLFVQGDDLWVTAALDPRLFAQGGRAEVSTPLGPRAVWISAKPGEGRLVRLT
ncbi:MAG: molecular chaperone DnaJ, partial [Phenylobacterium sp.]|uniref:J domain-containing protein n=1 Tax=Phenylobacterium sp. TaxID=1871053 RepID=UPI0027340E76